MELSEESKRAFTLVCSLCGLVRKSIRSGKWHINFCHRCDRA